MKTPCSVIQDLLPLYAEELTGEDSRKLVEDHLEECENCKQTLEELKEARPVTALTDTVPLQLVKQLLKKHTVAWCVLVGCLVAAIAFAVMGRLTEAEGVSYTKNAFEFGKTEAGLLYAKVTAKSPADVNYRTEYFHDEGGRECMSITGYTSPWLQLYGKSVVGKIYTVRSKEIKNIYYCDQRLGGKLTLLAGPSYSNAGNGAMLPRLVLNYYLLAALFLTALFGVMWLIFRKKAPGPTLLAVALVFGCYALAHFAVKGLNGTTYFLLQDLAFILLTTAALWGAAMAFLTLRKLGRQW